MADMDELSALTTLLAMFSLNFCKLITFSSRVSRVTTRRWMIMRQEAGRWRRRGVERKGM